MQSVSVAEIYFFLQEVLYYEKGIYKIIEDQVRFKPKTKEELKNAVDYYFKDSNYKKNKYYPMELWDTSLITDMSLLFSENKQFNLNINNWNVSRVTDMYGMFHNCINYNQPLNKWDVSRVTNMGCMFERCKKFNQLLNTWDVSSVNYMMYMFIYCVSFNQNLENWDTRSLINDFRMFEGCKNIKLFRNRIYV